MEYMKGNYQQDKYHLHYLQDSDYCSHFGCYTLWPSSGVFVTVSQLQ